MYNFLDFTIYDNKVVVAQIYFSRFLTYSSDTLNFHNCSS